MADAVAQATDPDAVGVSQETAQAARPDYTGKLCRGEEHGTVQGWLIDCMGCRIHFTGKLVRGGMYELASTNVYIPKYLQQPAIDRGQ